MKAMVLEDATPSRRLILREITVPAPGRGEVLVRVHASGVTPTELVWYPTTHTKAGAARRHVVPGHEFSGVVATVGAGVKEFAKGDAIYGMNDWFADGATAEYCLTVPTCIARKPARLTHAEAATVPIGALTAWQGLFHHAKLQKEERVLIHGGAGAVGLFAIQLAQQAGARVITTASARHSDLLMELGAEQVIDYKTEQFEKHVRDVDVVFDGVGGATLQRSWSVLKPSGRLVTIAANSEGMADERTKSAFFIVEPNQQQLAEIASRLDRGNLKSFVDGVVPLEEATSAYFGTAERRSGSGKLVVIIGVGS